MTDIPKRTDPAPAAERSSPTALDPLTLGRPVQLLPRFAAQLSEALGELFRSHNRRYRAAYTLGEISIKPLAAATLGAAASTGRWLVCDGAQGRLAAQIDRQLLLALLAQRYGDTPTLDLSVPETSTEERLLRLLGQQLLARTQSLIGSPDDLAGSGMAQISQTAQFAAGSWLIQVPVQEAGLGLQAQILLTLAPACIDRLLKRLGSELPARPERAALPDAAQVFKRLHLRLEARLLEQTLPLGELLALRPGDLIPVRLKSTEVLVDGSRLFTASVAEHQGKLCLTSFADAE